MNAATSNSPWGTVALVFLAILFPFAVFYLRFFRLWTRGFLAGVRIPIPALLGMHLLKVNPAVIVDGCIAARQGGVDVTPAQLEGHYLAGGNVRNVVLGLVVAHAAKVPLDFDRARSLDLEGHDLPDVVRQWVQEQQHGEGPSPPTDSEQ